MLSRVAINIAFSYGFPTADMLPSKPRNRLFSMRKKNASEDDYVFGVLVIIYS